MFPGPCSVAGEIRAIFRCEKRSLRHETHGLQFAEYPRPQAARFAAESADGAQGRQKNQAEHDGVLHRRGGVLFKEELAYLCRETSRKARHRGNSHSAARSDACDGPSRRFSAAGGVGASPRNIVPGGRPETPENLWSEYSRSRNPSATRRKPIRRDAFPGEAPTPFSAERRRRDEACGRRRAREPSPADL